MVAAAVLFAACGGPHGAYTPSLPTQAEAALDAVRALEREGRTTEALEGYRALCEAGEPLPRACHDRARLLLRTGATAAGRGASLQFLRRFPDSGLAQGAVKRLARSFLDSGELEAGLEALEALSAELSRTDAADSVDREIARLHEHAGDVDGQRRTLLRIAARGRFGSQLWDDALWRLSRLEGEAGDAGAEERWLRELLGAREPSRLIGSYESPHHDDAQLRLGLLRAEAGDVPGALGILLDLGERETSTLRDDALFEAARLELARGERSGACDLLRRVLAIRDASAGRRAGRLHGELGCEGAGE